MARRKKNVIKEKPRGVPSLSGFEVGQSIYCLRYPDRALARGVIKFLFKTKDDEFAEFVDDITGQFRATLLSDIIDEPTRSQINSANTKISTKIKKSEIKKLEKKKK